MRGAIVAGFVLTSLTCSVGVAKELSGGEGRTLNLSAEASGRGAVGLSNFDAAGDLIAIDTGASRIIWSVAEWRIVSDLDANFVSPNTSLTLFGAPCAGIGSGRGRPSRAVHFDCRTGKQIGEINMPVRPGSATHFVVAQSGRCSTALIAELARDDEIHVTAFDLRTELWLPQISKLFAPDVNAVTATDAGGRCRFLATFEGRRATRQSNGQVKDEPTVIAEIDENASLRRVVATFPSGPLLGPPRFPKRYLEAMRISPSGRLLLMDTYRDHWRKDGPEALSSQFELMDIQRGVPVERAYLPTVDDDVAYDAAWIDDARLVFAHGTELYVMNVTDGSRLQLPLPESGPIKFATEISYAPKTRVIAAKGESGIWFYRLPDNLP